MKPARLEHRGRGVAAPCALSRPWRLAGRARRACRAPRCAAPEAAAVAAEDAVASAQPEARLAQAAQNIVPAGSLRSRAASRARSPAGTAEQQHDATEPALALWVALSDDAARACAAQPEAMLAGLKALKVLGVWGVSLEIDWGAAEPAPRQYSWAAYRPVLALVREAGLRLQVDFCFHADERRTLPGWVNAVGEALPDVWFTDKSGARCRECLSLGVDDVPVLEGRTALQCYSDLIAAFASDHAALLGTTITDARVGLGPGGELRYPSHPAGDGRWAFPGVGEFQCYDAFMAGSLAAAAQQAGQPHWGSGGPHDAGSYSLLPHQSGFFHHQGSWASEYGRFFGEWYCGMLARHAERVLGSAAEALGGRGVRLHAALPLCHWWFHSAARAAELTAGYAARDDCDAYLPAFAALARAGAAAQLVGGELTDASQPASALASPEALLLQLRGVAAAAGVPVSLANAGGAFGGGALRELERRAFEAGCYRGVDVPPVSRVVVSEMGDAMFEPAAWTEFREWAARVRARGAALGGGGGGGGSGSVAAPPQQQREQQQQQQQQQRQPSAREAARVAAVVAAAAEEDSQYLPPPPLHPQQQQQQQQEQHQRHPQEGAGQWQIALLV
ncbi:beta-amylase chloroplastic-like [Raphidocelis subcapitata]|uniref:Beta-amylase n=1 Tax=Raphidocelis subcapitata TaxID=307507 RepID=A0A2V0NMG9_9CHLO|nr:beta-amylase chloroplastic-like [Raphidocelis subcapitata]|eukprot:GBF88708.1 beta-amylase chloroplastic-like [Raphidocelis subcapitata]